MLKNTSKRKKISVVAALALVAVSVGAWCVFQLTHTSQSGLDAPIRHAFAKVPSVTSYTQYVETRTKIGDRTLQIVGTYDVDHAQQRFGSYSTTTLFIGADTIGHSFTHWDVSIGNDVYIKVDSRDPVLQASIQRTPQWKHFTDTTIPGNYTSIAIAGPIQDNLTLLAQNGAYLSLLKNHGLERWGNEPLLRYTFTLSKSAFGISDGPLNALVGRIGKNGTVDVWIDPHSFDVRYLLFTSDPYFSTTTISHINTPLPIDAPLPLSS